MTPVVTQLNLGRRQFGHCFGTETGGLLVFGSNEIELLLNYFDVHVRWIPLLNYFNPHGWYKVKTVGFRIEKIGADATTSAGDNGQDIQNSSSLIPYNENLDVGYHGTVLDTGSSTLSMPRKTANELVESIMQYSGYSYYEDKDKVYDYCLRSKSGQIEYTESDWKYFLQHEIMKFPLLFMLWEGGEQRTSMDPFFQLEKAKKKFFQQRKGKRRMATQQQQQQEIDSETNNNGRLEIRIPPSQYLFHKHHKICIDLFGDTPSILVGSNVMADKFFIYDRDTMRLGVADFPCDELVYKADAIALSYSQQFQSGTDQ
ncbi:hypothetical protein RFI_17965, partial [Reticulomyxa filosa]